MLISTMKITRGLLPLAALAAALNLPAAIVSTTLTGANGTFPVSRADLINADNPAFSSITLDSGSELYGSSVYALNDGEIYQGQSASATGPTLTPADGSVVTILLNTNSAPSGYALKSVVSLTGSGQGRAAQTYAVAVATVSSGVFTPLFSVANVGGGGETQVATRDDQGQPLATGVYALQITFHNANGMESMYREFDVFVAGALPSITTQPQDQAAELGAPASFSVGATGPGPLLYQWQFNGAAIDPAINTTASTTNLVLPAVAITDMGAYRVAVDSASGITVSR